MRVIGEVVVVGGDLVRTAPILAEKTSSLVEVVTVSVLVFLLATTSIHQLFSKHISLERYFFAHKVGAVTDSLNNLLPGTGQRIGKNIWTQYCPPP